MFCRNNYCGERLKQPTQNKFLFSCFFNPLTPRSDREVNSPSIFNTVSVKQTSSENEENYQIQDMVLI